MKRAWNHRMATLTLMAAFGTMGFMACTTQEVGEDDDESSSGPRCGDGDVNGDEQCDGSAFGEATCASQGFEEGALTCTSECTIEVTGCYIKDDDGDGLDTFAEEAAGTDPLLPDTDGDGFWDGPEVEAGTNPLDIYSWPQNTGQWPNRYEASLEGTAGRSPASGEGNLILNQTFTDQHGQFVQLHQFYGYVTVISVGAVWCPPCNQAAASSQALWDEWRDQGVIFVESLVAGPQQGVKATDQDVTNWVTQYQMEFPVVRPEFNLLQASSLPTFYIVDRELTQVEIIEGYPGDPALSTSIQAAINASGG